MNECKACEYCGNLRNGIAQDYYEYFITSSIRDLFYARRVKPDLCTY